MNNNSNKTLTALSHQLATLYFYAISTRQTIVFRVVSSQTVECSSVSINSQAPSVTPVIILSSTTAAMRDKLRSFKVKLFCLDSTSAKGGDSGREYQEDDTPFESQHDAGGGGDSPLAKKELELLRKAQASGATVGANVSFKWNKNNSGHQAIKKQSRRRTHPPLYIRGMDDCVAFCEVYLNTLGFTLGPYYDDDDDDQWNTAPGLLPRLYSRRLGPFLHAHLETLRVSSKRIRSTTSTSAPANEKQSSVQNQGRNSSNMSFNNHMMMDVLEVSGTILPCAYNELLCSAIQCIKLDETSTTTTTISEENMPASTTTSTTEDIRSHHLVMYAKPLEEDDNYDDIQILTTEPRCASSLLNGVGMTNPRPSRSSTTESSDSFCFADTPSVVVKECDIGHAVSVAVWDAASQDAIAFNADLVMPL